MAREEFDTCPKCGVGKMKPTGGAATATSADPDTNRLTGDYYQEYKCDSCGYPEGGQAKAVRVNDEQEGLRESSINSGRNNNSSDIDSKNNQPF
jgi:predicted nucleic-acid-binding Zn-ribbon protein